MKVPLERREQGTMLHISRAPSITVLRTEILYSRIKPDDFILGIVEFLGENG